MHDQSNQSNSEEDQNKRDKGQTGDFLYPLSLERQFDLLECDNPHKLKYYLKHELALAIKQGYLNHLDSEAYSIDHLFDPDHLITLLPPYTYIKIQDKTGAPRLLRTTEQILKTYLAIYSI